MQTQTEPSPPGKHSTRTYKANVPVKEQDHIVEFKVYVII